MHPFRFAAVAAALTALTAATVPGMQTPAPPDAPRPIAAVDSLWTEELTWMEVRDALRAGKTTILIGTGGVEQNGPYVAVELGRKLAVYRAGITARSFQASVKRLRGSSMPASGR